ncbi:hypothetical protein [Streptomyces sp. NPDC050535]|uniref:hypothetical protein n=1 Tax=Streptomyces sp. NPDC050535 TaxID=3365626 RepID=UPI0037971FD2
MAGTSPPPPTTRLTKPPPSDRNGDPAAALAQALITEQLKETETSRWRNMWEFLKRLFRRSTSSESSSAGSESSSAGRGNGRSNSWAGDEQTEPLLRQEREPSAAQEERKPSAARQALESLSPDKVREVAVAMWKLIDENPKYLKAYDEGRLPLAGELREFLPRDSEMTMSPLAKSLTLPPSAEERFSRTAPVSDDTTRTRPGTSDAESRSETKSEGDDVSETMSVLDDVSDTMSLIDDAEPVPLLDQSNKAFLDRMMRGADPARGGPGDHGDALTAQTIFERRRAELRSERERPTDSVTPPGPERTNGSDQNPVKTSAVNLLPQLSPGSQSGEQTRSQYVLPPNHTSSAAVGGQKRGRK